MCALAAGRRRAGRAARLALLLAGAPAGSCRPAAEPAARTGRLRVLVSIPPQAYFVERVGGELVRVEVLVEPGQSPHTYEPGPKLVARLAAADVYFALGLPFERQLLRKISGARRRLEIVDTATAGRQAGGSEGGGRGAAGAREGALDPHEWLSPRLAGVQARLIAQTLARLDAGHAPRYRANLKSFLDDLAAVDAGIRRVLAPYRGRQFLVFHPAYGHFAEHYGLKQVAVQSAGKEPGPRAVAALIEEARRAGIKTIFVQPQFSSRGAQVIARAIGARVVPLDPLARDYLGNLQDMAAKLTQALGGGAPRPRGRP